MNKKYFLKIIILSLLSTISPQKSQVNYGKKFTNTLIIKKQKKKNFLEKYTKVLIGTSIFGIATIIYWIAKFLYNLYWSKRNSNRPESEERSSHGSTTSTIQQENSNQNATSSSTTTNDLTAIYNVENSYVKGPFLDKVLHWAFSPDNIRDRIAEWWGDENVVIDHNMLLKAAQEGDEVTLYRMTLHPNFSNIVATNRDAPNPIKGLPNGSIQEIVLKNLQTHNNLHYGINIENSCPNPLCPYYYSDDNPQGKKKIYVYLPYGKYRPQELIDEKKLACPQCRHKVSSPIEKIWFYQCDYSVKYIISSGNNNMVEKEGHGSYRFLTKQTDGNTTYSYLIIESWPYLHEIKQG